MNKDPQRILVINSLVFFACYVSSYIALSEALPPGFSTPLWPAAGIGIAAALMYGYAVIPGIWLGAWALNFFHDEFWNNPPDLQLILFQLSCVVATGSTIQAYVARYLTKKLCGMPVQLDSLRSVLLYLFLILPTACLIASTLGSFTLIAFEKSPPDFAGITWLTWWIGDVVGAALFSTMTFCFFGEPQKLWRPRRLLLGIPTAIIICSLVFLYHKTAGWQSDRMAEHVQHHSIQLELELALIKRNSDLKWADFLETMPREELANAHREEHFLVLLHQHFPNIQSLSVQRGNKVPLFVWNKIPGPVDTYRKLRKASHEGLKSSETHMNQRYVSELFTISSSRLGIVHKAVLGNSSAPGLEIVAVADLSQDLQVRLAAHKVGDINIDFGPKPSIQTQKIENKNPFMMQSNNVFQQVAYSVSMPTINILRASSFEYIVVMLLSVVFTLAVLGLLLLSSGQSYHFERLFHERTEALHEQKMITEHASKLAALGEMAGSIAHEINNPLAIIQGYSEILQTKLNRGHFNSEEIKHGLERIEQTCRRISAIIVSLRSYARNDPSDKLVPCSTREIVTETLELCREGLKDRAIEIHCDKVADVDIMGSKAGLMQVLLNLIANARDAISQLPKRWIHISIEEETDHDTVSIRVSDSGNGIPKDLQEKIMLPFFTTKPIGKGTGLGLSISRNLMQSMGGELELDRAAPHTSFVIKIKKYHSPEAPRPPALLTRAHELSHI